MDGLEEATCPSCSLVVKVIYNKVRRNSISPSGTDSKKFRAFLTSQKTRASFIHEFILWAVEMSNTKPPLQISQYSTKQSCWQLACLCETLDLANKYQFRYLLFQEKRWGFSVKNQNNPILDSGSLIVWGYWQRVLIDNLHLKKLEHENYDLRGTLHLCSLRKGSPSTRYVVIWRGSWERKGKGPKGGAMSSSLRCQESQTRGRRD